MLEKLVKVEVTLMCWSCAANEKIDVQSWTITIGAPPMLPPGEIPDEARNCPVCGAAATRLLSVVLDFSPEFEAAALAATEDQVTEH